jgi:hypothetical protein
MENLLLFLRKKTMKTIYVYLGIILPMLMLTSCATIFSGTKADIKVTSNPPNLKVYSVNRKKQPTELGVTPCIITIKKTTPFLVVKGDGFYDETYNVKENAKTEPTAWLNMMTLMWGYIVIDMPTGAAIKPEKEVNFEMKKIAK